MGNGRYKRNRVGAVLLVLLCSALLDGQEASGHFLIPSHVKWKHPHGVPEGVFTATVTVLFYTDDYIFVRDDCWITRKDGRVTISNGDPHNEFAGTWEPIPDGISYRYRLIRRTIYRANETAGAKECKGTASTMPKVDNSGNFEFEGKEFREIEPTNAREYAATYRALAVSGANAKKD